MQAGMLRLSFVLTLFCGLQDELRSSAALLLNADLLHPTAAAAELPCSFQEACTEYFPSLASKPLQVLLFCAILDGECREKRTQEEQN